MRTVMLSVCLCLHAILWRVTVSGSIPYCHNPGTLTAMRGVIYSHQDFGRDKYPDFMRCEWHIVGRPSKIIRLHFNAFEMMWNCRDSLTICCGANKRAKRRRKMCGFSRPEDFFSRVGEGLILTFDSTRHRRILPVREVNYVFNITYTIIDPPVTVSGSTPHCHNPGTLTAMRGVIYSHLDFGRDKYLDFMRCKWYIVGRPRKIIRLHFNAFKLQKEFRDSLTIYTHSGADTRGRFRRTMSGRPHPEDFLSGVGEGLSLEFDSNRCRGYDGFNITYTIIDPPVIATGSTPHCNNPGNLTAMSGVILSHQAFGRGTYLDFMRCKWHIVGHPGKVIRLHFNLFKLDNSEGGYCFYDSLSIYDSAVTGGRLRRKLCGYIYHPEDYFSNVGEGLILKFVSNDGIGYNGFNITYTIIDPPPISSPYCNNPGNRTAMRGVIFSHQDFGRGNYIDYMHCEWHIVGRPGKVIRLHFTVFELERSYNCDIQSLSVHDGAVARGRLRKKLCKPFCPEDVFSNVGEGLSLTFDLNGGGRNNGFSITYTIINPPDEPNGNDTTTWKPTVSEGDSRPVP